VPHCRQFGMGNMEDLGPRFLLHFVFETDPMSSTDRRVGAMTTMHAQQGSSGADPAMFFKLPLPWR